MGEEVEQDDFVLRPYQSEILETAIKENTIVYLPTGAGKTYIAVMLINRLSHSLLKPHNKLSVLLVNTVPLVEQHCATIRRHTDFEVGQFTGDLNVDYWSKDQWITQLEKYQVFVMTAQIFLDILRHGYLNLEKVNLIIFDECHQAVNDQPMRQIMQLFQNIKEAEQPRVLGLTATLLNGNCSAYKVLEEVRSLEKTFHGKVATVKKVAEVIGFSTNPQEKIKYFNPQSQIEAVNTALSMLNKLREFILGVKLKKDKPTSPRKLLNQENDSKPLVRIINSLILHIEMCGVYGGSKATVACLIQIERLKRQAEDSFIERIFSAMATTLSAVLKLLDDTMEGYQKSAQIMLFSTPQVLTLIEILRTFKDNPENFCGIVFVKQRFTAKVLYYVIKSLSECDPDFHFITTEFMVGYNAGSGDRDTREAFYSAKINKKIVTSFRNNEINLLIASSVVEEGIDIPRCTLVVKFDRPMDYRSYIQSKGRARHGDSQYIIMVPLEERDKYQKSYQNFQKVEELLQNFLVGKTDEREAPSEHEIKKELYEDHDVPPYYVNGPDSPHVAAVSAISLLNRYCQSLNFDKYAILVPNWYLEKEENRSGTYYVVVIEMPIMCPLRDVIKGQPMVTKTAAKRAAAMEVCKRLHQIGELTNHLLPRTEMENELDFEYLFKHWAIETDTETDGNNDDRKDKPKPGTKKFIRQYNIPIPQTLKSMESKTYYLHPIVMKTDNDWDKLLKKILVHTTLDYALLTSSPIPSLCQFPIFVSAGTLEITILENQSFVELNDDELNDLKKFNHFLFYEVLRVLKDFLVYNTQSDGFMIVVPISNNLPSNYLELDVDSYLPIDFNNLSFKIDMDVARQNTNLNPVDEPSIQDKINLDANNETHLGKIINPWYRNSDPYVVLQVCSSKNAHSPWPNDNFKDYESYYHIKYPGVQLYNPTLPLLFVRGISRRFNCLLPRSKSLHAGSKRNKAIMQEGMEEHLIPEMCVLQKFPGTLWYKAHCLPTILHRILHLLQAEELRVKITEDIKIGCVDHASHKKWSAMPVDSRILHKEEKKIQPVPQRNVCETDTAAITGNATINHLKKKRLTNKDYAAKMLEKQYNWKAEDEPVDIDRNIDNVTLLEIQHYDRFISEKYCYDEAEKSTGSPKASKYLAITLDKEYEEMPIKMLDRTKKQFGPQQWEIYQCLVSNKANDILNLERLETLGDSLLKLSATLFLFLKYPECNEGRLTNVKSKVIGNRNLLYCGLQKNLGGYMKVSDFSPNTDWIPPSYCVPKMLREKIDNKELSANKLFEFGVPLEEQIKGELSKETEAEFTEIIIDVNAEEPVSSEPITSMNKFLGCQNVQDKTISDCVEALIGAYLQSNGLEGGLAMIGWFGIIPNELNPRELFYHTPPSPLIHPSITQEDIDYHIPMYEKLEEKLGYKFQNRAYLLQAMTHASYSVNRFTDCYQRLEFLGDAVLDFLITSHIFEISETLTPGQLTDLRSALVNNVTFAVLVARYGFQKQLKTTNTKLMDTIETFVKFQEERDFTINEEALILVEEHPMYIAEHVHVPKVLGDIFESLAGAVFLDTGMDLQRTWSVFHRLMWREIESFRVNVPRNPVRMLYEYTSAAPQFEKAKVIEHKVTLVSCSVMVKGKKHVVHGFGENKTQAKRAAAKLGLHLLSSD